MKNKKNVLCVFLSDLKQKRGGGYYYYRGENQSNSSETITGIHTNEPIAKYIIEELAGKNEKLDKVIMICTEKIRKSLPKLLQIEQEKNINNAKNLVSTMEYFRKIMQEFDDKCSDEDISALRYYELSLIDFIQKDKFDQLYIEEKMIGIETLREDRTDLFKIIPINDNPNENETYSYLSKMTKEIDDDTNLYIDLNGGFRDAAFILLAVSRIVQQKGVNIAGCYHIDINWECTEQTPMIIKDKRYLFDTFDLISGTDEFFQYGGVKKLSDFLDKAKLNSVGLEQEREMANKIKSSMEKVSDSLAVCCVEDAWEALSELRKNINTTREYCQKDSNNGSKYKVFFHLLENIEREYGELLNKDKEKDYLGLIEWCNNKCMIQQALTFFEDAIPEVIVEKHLIYWDEKKLTPDCINAGNRFPQDALEYTFINSIYKICLNYFTNEQRKNDVEALKGKLIGLRKGWKENQYNVQFYEKKEKFKFLYSYLGKEISYKELKKIFEEDDYLERIASKRAQIILQTKGIDEDTLLSKYIDGKVICTELNVINYEKLDRFYSLYKEIKNIRNNANHGKNSIKCKDIRNKLKAGIKDLRELIEIKELK